MVPCRMLKVALVVLLVLALQGGAFVLYQAVEEERTAAENGPFDFEPLVGADSAPDLELERPDGSRMRLSDLRGRWVLVHFWATWCPPCSEELPAMLELTRNLSEEVPLELVAVSLKEPWEDVRRFFGGEPPTEVLCDATGDGHERYGVTTLPVTWLVTPGGKFAIRFNGARDWRAPEARRFLRTTLGIGQH